MKSQFFLCSLLVAVNTASASPNSSPVVNKPNKVSTSISTSSLEYASTVPNIDVCGAGSSGNISCPGAGSNGYYYRCCSNAGHCGPKNSLQAQSLYCGTSNCQKGYGKCDESLKPPPNPTVSAGSAQNGETCGPIVNKRCAAPYCCSGSNYCGTGPDFCGSANWCQPRFGNCSSA